jgi:hypothetical protein
MVSLKRSCKSQKHNYLKLTFSFILNHNRFDQEDGNFIHPNQHHEEG